MLLVCVFDVSPDLVLFGEDEGDLFVTADAERLGVVGLTLCAEDLNLDGAIPFPCVAALLDVTDVWEPGEYLLMARLEGVLITPEFLRLEFGVRMDVDFTRERELIVFPEE